MIIPDSWTFKNEDIADCFDSHVREQLPWYPMVSDMVSHIATCFLQEKDILIDLGCSLGEVTKRLRHVIKDRDINCLSVDSSNEMIKKFIGEGKAIIGNIEQPESLPQFNVCVMMLSFMFTSVNMRRYILEELIGKCKKGGCVIIVDKIELSGGYISTVLSRMSIRNKMISGVDGSDIIKKEMSLCGAQRPINEDMMKMLNFKKWFQLGDFAGYVFVNDDEK